jgi:[ribosomal protein S5]-alanine N-acetyltransferase
MEILETPRLRLRRLLPTDLATLVRLYSDPAIRRYFPEGTLTPAETREELDWFLNGHPAAPQLGLWATVAKASQEVIGRCGLIPWTIEGRAEVEVAYLLDTPYWRQGLGTEVARALVQYGFTALDLPRLVCLIDPANAASIKVATNAGMTLERAMADEHGPFLLYAIHR